MPDGQGNDQASETPDPKDDRVKGILRKMRKNAVDAAKSLAREMAEPPLEAYTVWSDGLRGEDRNE